MKLLVSLAEQFVRAGDGAVYTGGPHRYEFWTRYLQVFDEVVVHSRVRPVDAPDPGWTRVNGDQVSVWDLPQHVGPWEYLANRSMLKAITKSAVQNSDAYILRSGGGAVPMLVWKAIRPQRRPYGVEVTGDPWAALGPGTVKTWARPIGRRLYARNLRLQCRHAAAASYVTRQALQSCYPPGRQTHAIGCSDVDMPPEAYVAQPRQFNEAGRTLILVGAFDQFYKGPDVLVRAVAACAKRGLPLCLRFVGGGKRIGDLERLIASLGIEDRVEFLGQVGQRSEVIKALDKADLFVLPSRQEGLPRAMVEAMGRALPCIGSTVGGIPELLAPEDMMPAGDEAALARKIFDVLRDPERMNRMSSRSLDVARQYSSSTLVPMRTEFYRNLKTLPGA